jgi:predicted DNA-binding transcriptional regulator AlpA
VEETTDEPRERWVTVAEVEERTGVDRSTIWRWEQRGIFPRRFYLDPDNKKGPRWLESVLVEYFRRKAEEGRVA